MTQLGRQPGRVKSSSASEAEVGSANLTSILRSCQLLLKLFVSAPKIETLIACPQGLVGKGGVLCRVQSMSKLKNSREGARRKSEWRTGRVTMDHGGTNLIDVFYWIWQENPVITLGFLSVLCPVLVIRWTCYLRKSKRDEFKKLWLQEGLDGSCSSSYFHNPRLLITN